MARCSISCCLVALLACAPSGSRSQRAEPPHVVLIIIDTLRADHLDVYGYHRKTAPNLEKLANEGWLFRRAYSSSTWTLPSTGSMFTGLYPSRHGLRHVDHRLPDSANTIAEIAAENDYETAAFVDGGFLSSRWGFAQGFDLYEETAGNAWDVKDVEVVVEQAIRWLRDPLRGARPFFLVVHTYETHMPYVNPEGFADPWLSEPMDRATSPLASINQIELDPRRKSADYLQSNIDLYDGEIRRADHYIGQFLDALDELSDDRDVAVLVTSDHGEEFLDHGNMEHGLGKVYDANVRVPMILKVPGRRGGVVLDTPVSGIDVFSTLADLMGVQEAAGDGTSLLTIAAHEIAEGALDRPLRIEGINSLREVRERRLRIEQGSQAAIIDLARDLEFWYDRTDDPELRRPTGEPGTDGFRGLVEVETIAGSGADFSMLTWVDEQTTWRTTEESSFQLVGRWQNDSFEAAVFGSEGESTVSSEAGAVGRVRLAVRYRGREKVPRIEVSTGEEWADVRLRRWNEDLDLAQEASRSLFLIELPPRLPSKRQPLTNWERNELRSLGYL